MLTLDQIRKRLQIVNISALAKKCDVHQNTLHSIKNGGTTSYEIVKKLSDYFIALEEK